MLELIYTEFLRFLQAVVDGGDGHDVAHVTRNVRLISVKSRSIKSRQMISQKPTLLVRLGNLVPGLDAFARCEFLAPSGCFKIRGAAHLLE